jgi:rRNA-processing protein FCF1
MLSVLDDLIREHRDTGVLVDTNMLLVYLVGLLEPVLVERVNPNRAYSLRDFERVATVLSQFKTLIVTPAILAEVTNLAASRLLDFHNGQFLRMLASALPTSRYTERLVKLDSVCARKGFALFGFTDATVEEVGASGVPVFTDDSKLYERLSSLSIKVFNYNHIRMLP